jgi:hypothetical protein
MSRDKPKGRLAKPTPQPAPLNVLRAIESFDTSDAISDEMRELVARNHPELLAKLQPPKRPAPSINRVRKAQPNE